MQGTPKSKFSKKNDEDSNEEDEVDDLIAEYV